MRIRVLKSVTLLLCCLACFGLSIAQAHAKPKAVILFIPLDNRPVCNDYPVKVLTAAGYKIHTPPAKLLPSRFEPADTEALWKWIEKKAGECTAAVISTDTLIYGGLVPSRTHHLSLEELESSILKIQSLKLQKNINLYAFSTIMRTPEKSYGGVEPFYYSNIGPVIYKYSQFCDKIDINDASFLDILASRVLERDISKAYLSDWLDRRSKNLEVNRRLSEMVRNGEFHYLAVGKDDNAPLSHTHMEARKLNLSNADIPDVNFQILPGVDQLGLLLLTRAVNELNGKSPKVYTVYTDGTGSETIPQYSDLPLEKSVPQQIIAAGGQCVTDINAADLILAINSPPDGEMADSTYPDNIAFASPANKKYIANLEKMMDAGRTISLADVAYSNGADNGFMNELGTKGMLTRLVAYNGWNTADNTIGFAIAQGILAPEIKKDDQLQLMRERVIDDWFYQANARRYISERLEKDKQTPIKYNLGSAAPVIHATTMSICKAMAKKYDLTKNTTFDIQFPWSRLFEVDVTNIKTPPPPKNKK